MSLAEQAIRLRRCKWSDRADLLAEELYTILLQDKDPSTGPITVNIPGQTNSSVLPSQQDLGQLGDLQFPDLVFPNIEIPPLPTPEEIDNGGDIFTRINRKNQHVQATVPGLILESGSGGNHVVACYPYGVSGQASAGDILNAATFGINSTLQVRELNGLQVDAGTYVMVFRHSFVEIETRETVKREGGGEEILDTQTSINVISSNTEMVKPGGASSGGGGGVPCQITAGGPGNEYTADLYPDGITGTAVSASVYQLDIDAAETIPAGTWTMANSVEEGDPAVTTWYIQVPIWL